MIDEKKLANAAMNEEELDNVAGGTRIETWQDGDELVKRGLLTEEQAFHSAPVRDKLHEMGYTGYKDNGGIINGNIYTDKNGNNISREDFWKNFDAENGTKIIRN